MVSRSVNQQQKLLKRGESQAIALTIRTRYRRNAHYSNWSVFRKIEGVTKMLARGVVSPLLFAISFTQTVGCENQSDSAIAVADSPTFYGFRGFVNWFRMSPCVNQFGFPVFSRTAVVSAEPHVNATDSAEQLRVHRVRASSITGIVSMMSFTASSSSIVQ